ncbi:unnamed protein product [Angiostrongylus costaricensis]|uniref:Protein kinase domain-containing protein n=1 Tax=Angiostrongylus costaricensis TaxID=334426 RepID=A0A0R3PA54_ANGCS|nr:unnamed protein product [Angiostrongylus costaricensis]
MKTEMTFGNRQMLRLKIEVMVLMKCHEQTDPKKKEHFVAFFLVMGLVGPSLEDIRKKDLVRNYTKSTAMQCCIQTMIALRDLHGIGYLHRDIKPQNYAIGLGPKESTIYMLDFGIARKFTEENTRKIKVPRIKVHFLGTLRFASRACHKQIEQGPKDDMECWLYMVWYLRNSLAAISKEARVDFSKPLDWAGITKRRAEKAEKELQVSRKTSAGTRLQTINNKKLVLEKIKKGKGLRRGMFLSDGNMKTLRCNMEHLLSIVPFTSQLYLPIDPPR